MLQCTSLTNVAIPRGVTNIGMMAFGGCTSLMSVTIPGGVTSIEDGAFSSCTSLTAAFFEGDAPDVGRPDFNYGVFSGATNTTVYYLPGTRGWTYFFVDRPKAPWHLPYPVILTGGTQLGIQTNGFGVTISWATNAALIVEASTNLSGSAWTPLSTNNLFNGVAHFRDPEWANHLQRFYRITSPVVQTPLE